MELEKFTDYSLIKKAQQGNMQAFEELLYKYDRLVMNIAFSFRNDPEDAKDIYQEVFMRVYKGLKNFKFKSEFSTWIYRIATNVCITYHNNMRKHNSKSLNKEINLESESETVLADTIEGGLRTDDKAISSNLSSHIQNALDELPAKQKLAFTLKYYDGFKIREIAGMMNCNDGTIKRYLFTATNKMREKLKDLI